jgi:hypothetical protein
MAVEDLNSLAADEFGAMRNESQFQRSFRRRGVEGNTKLARDARELAAIRSSKCDLLALLMKTVNELHALIVGAAAGEH